MSVREKLSIVAFAAALGGLIVPALAQDQSGVQRMPDQGMGMGHRGEGMMRGGMMAGGMMAGGMMAGGMMAGGCSEMMQSMNNGGDGRPNSQWQKRPRHPENGG